jgi:pseudouridine-5'-phosphate glycosidase
MAETARTGRGVVVANPIPEAAELDASQWAIWLTEAQARATAEGCVGRGVTPRVLGILHEVSGGRTLDANISLVKANAALAAQIVAAGVDSRT